MISLKKLLTEDKKIKIYVQKGKKPPKGKQLKKGPRGGQYFVGSPSEKQEYEGGKSTAPVKKSKVNIFDKPKKKPVSKDPYGQSPSNKNYGGPPPDSAKVKKARDKFNKMRQQMLDKLTDHYEEDYLDQGYDPEQALDAAEEMANDDLVGVNTKNIDDRYKEIMGDDEYEDDNEDEFSDYATDDPMGFVEYLQDTKNLVKDAAFDWKEEDEASSWLYTQSAKGHTVYQLDAGDDSITLFATKKPLDKKAIEHFKKGGFNIIEDPKLEADGDEM